MKCETCGNGFEAQRSSAKYCSAKCRKLAFQNKDGEVSVPSLEHYYANPDMYATRNAPEKLNWGPHMDATELAGSKFTANRVNLPGDWDYTLKNQPSSLCAVEN